MKVTVSAIELPGVALAGENPLPVFRSPVKDADVRSDSTLLPEEEYLLGFEAGERVLPYAVQDRYDRNRSLIKVKSVVLDNGVMRAVFLPELGGRLYSLTDLRTGKELVFKNPVLQFANLAILNAWFSGGIEWNVSQRGHTFTTCKPMFFARLIDGSGNEFVRMYEYERQKGLFWQIDFHLPKESEFLQAHVRIVNDSDSPTPMYYWANIAVPENGGTRVFSSINEVIYQNKESVFKYLRDNGMELGGAAMRSAPGFFGHGVMPYLTNVNGRLMDFDVSYPMNYKRSNEYFFQNPKDMTSPWEAAVYKDGFVFFERSTAPLVYRKMFCWGSHKGGRKWCDYLSVPGKGDYVEIQAGIARTQNHGYIMPADSVIQFTQIFGGRMVASPESMYQDWDSSQVYIKGEIDAALPESAVLLTNEKLSELALMPGGELIHLGSGWGALELIRRAKAGGKTPPAQLLFPNESIGKEQEPWLRLLEEGYFEPVSCAKTSPSFMVDINWMEMLEKSLLNEKSDQAEALIHLGIMLYENGRHEDGADMWRRSVAIKDNPLARRNLAVAYARQNNKARALEEMRRAFELEYGSIDKAYAEEYMRMLLDNGDHKDVWELYHSLPQDIREDERILILASEAAVELGEHEFIKPLFNRELAVIREGETIITDLWYRVQALRLAEEQGVLYSSDLIDQARRTLEPPGIIDMRMSAVI